MENSTNAFHKTCTDNKDVCTYIPKIKVCYMPLLCQQSKTPPLLEATWGIRILVVWNKATRGQLITNIPPWLVRENKTRPITSGNLEFYKRRHHSLSEPSTERILPRMAKICRLPKDSRNTVINANIGGISDTHIHTARSPFIMCIKSVCYDFTLPSPRLCTSTPRVEMFLFLMLAVPPFITKVLLGIWA